ncbi:MAG: single-stranded DNA-binding protein [Actinomycetes bacterium]
MKSAEPPLTARNEVLLVGRMSPIYQERDLPSGDHIVEFRIVVDRLGAPGKSVDTIDVALWRARLQKRVKGFDEGDWIEVHGCLRRRFWSGAHGVTSRWQVEASEVRLL